MSLMTLHVHTTLHLIKINASGNLEKVRKEAARGAKERSMIQRLKAQRGTAARIMVNDKRVSWDDRSLVDFLMSCGSIEKPSALQTSLVF